MNEVLESTKVEYDPSKTYTWDPTVEFTLKGPEFGFMINALTDKKQELLKQLQIISLLEAKLKEAVENGDAVAREDS